MPEDDKQIRLTVSEELLGAVDHRAKVVGMTRNEWIERALTLALRISDAAFTPVVKPVEGACLHPRDKRRDVGWATLCGVCFKPL